jgi:hypothetical protein
VLYQLELRRQESRRRDSNPQQPAEKAKDPPSAQQADMKLSRCGGQRQSIDAAARPGFEPGAPGSGPGVVPVPPPRTVLVGHGSGREDSNLRHPLCGRGGLAADLLVVRWSWCCRSRASWSRTTSSRGISAVPSPSGSRPSCTWSRKCSNLLLPGFNRPLHHQSFRTVEPAAGLEPTAPRVRTECPSTRTSPAWRCCVGGGSRTLTFDMGCRRAARDTTPTGDAGLRGLVWSAGVEPASSAWRAEILEPLNDDHVAARGGLEPP